MLDEAVYTTAVPTPRSLDNLYAAHLIDPTIAVFVGQRTGDAWRTDIYFRAAFVAFLANEILAYVQREYGFEADRTRTILIGDSRGYVTVDCVA